MLKFELKKVNSDKGGLEKKPKGQQIGHSEIGQIRDQGPNQGQFSVGLEDMTHVRGITD